MSKDDNTFPQPTTDPQTNDGAFPSPPTFADLRDYNSTTWYAGHGAAPSHSKSGNAASPVPSQPGGEKISHAELAAYSNRPDRDYNGAGRAEHDIPAFSYELPMTHPRTAEPPKKVG